MTKQDDISREAFEALLSGCTADQLALLLRITQYLKAARDAGDTRPPEVILEDILKEAGIDWPAKEDNHDRTA